MENDRKLSHVTVREAMLGANPALNDVLYKASLEPEFEEFVSKPIEDLMPEPDQPWDD